MKFDLDFSKQAIASLRNLESNPMLNKKLRSVRKALGYLQMNPRHPGLHSHKYHIFPGYENEEIFEVYAENNIPAAYRIFWHYGPGKDVITIFAIIMHP